jgi:UTP--glucose-1-phosphate uridylyltransferase
MEPIQTAVILAAGLGTRMLPATKAIPKEMLPVVDKPLIQYAVEEAVAAGIEHVVMVIAEGKEAIREHFAAEGRAVDRARSKGRPEVTAAVEAPAKLARISYVTQEAPRGVADAVACARPLVAGAPFALMFPDDLILGDTPCIGQLIDVHRQRPGTVIAVEHVPDSEISNYGVVDPGSDANPARVRALVEKPSAREAPSNLGIVGRYILAPSIFEHIARMEPGAGGELQITDAIARQVAAGEAVHAFAYDGDRYDTGRPAGYVAANVAAALRRTDLRNDLLGRIRPLINQGKANA